MDKSIVCGFFGPPCISTALLDVLLVFCQPPLESISSHLPKCCHYALLTTMPHWIDVSVHRGEVIMISKRRTWVVSWLVINHQVGLSPCVFTVKRVYRHADLSPIAEKFSHRNQWGLEMLGGRRVEFCPKTLRGRNAWRLITSQLTTDMYRWTWQWFNGRPTDD